MKLKELRGKTTQKELSKMLNISDKNISNYENGNTEPDIATLIKIADFFDVSLDFLCNRQWNNQIGYIPENRKELIKKVIELNNNEAERVSAFIDGLTGRPFVLEQKGDY